MQIRAEIIELSPHLHKYERASSNCHEVNFEAGGKVFYPQTREALTFYTVGTFHRDSHQYLCRLHPTSKRALQWLAHVFIRSPSYSRFATQLFLDVHKKLYRE